MYWKAGSSWREVRSYPIVSARELRFVPDPSPLEIDTPAVEEYPFLGEWRMYAVPNTIEVTTAHNSAELRLANVPIAAHVGGGIYRVRYTRNMAHVRLVDPAHMGVVEINLLLGEAMQHILDVVVYGTVLLVQQEGT